MAHTYTALVIHPNGTLERKTAKSDDLDSFQALVGGGYVEALQAPEGVFVLVDEEGLYKPDLAPNPIATAVCGVVGVPQGAMLVGPVAFVGTHPRDYEELGDVPDSVVEAAQRVANSVLS